MKKKAILITLIFIFCTIFVIYNISKNKPNSIATKEITEAIHYKYTIKDYKGRIAIFKYGKEVPLEIFDIYTDSLPNEDSYKIQKGLNVIDEKELQRLIEDYTG
jgi:hypothetical protein